MRPRSLLCIVVIIIGAAACEGDPQPSMPTEPSIPEAPPKPAPKRVCECARPKGFADLEGDPVVGWAVQRSLYESLVARPSLSTDYDPLQNRAPPPFDGTWHQIEGFWDSKETGFWVYQYKDESADAKAQCGGKPAYYYDVSPILHGMQHEVDLQEDVWGTPPATQADNVTPLMAEGRTVAAVHVHPNSGSSAGRASDRDVASAEARGIPSAVLHNRGGNEAEHFPYTAIPDYQVIPYGAWDPDGRIGGRTTWECCTSMLALRGAEQCLPATCGWTMTFTGPEHAGTYEGDRVSILRGVSPSPTTLNLSTSDNAFPGTVIQTFERLPEAPATLLLGPSTGEDPAEIGFDGILELGFSDANYMSGDGGPCCGPDPNETLPPLTTFTLDVNETDHVAGTVTGTLWDIDSGNPIVTGAIELTFTAQNDGICAIVDPLSP